LNRNIPPNQQTKTKMKPLMLVSILGLILGASHARAEAPKETKTKDYPLQTCVVSGEKLGEMGDPYVFEHEGKQVKLCCKSCLKTFNKEPAKYLKKIDDAAAKK
jgi:YHS domain-containing protein